MKLDMTDLTEGLIWIGLIVGFWLGFAVGSSL